MGLHPLTQGTGYMPRAKVPAKMAKFFLLLFIMALALFPGQASAIGVGASPSELNFNVHPLSSATETLYVVNTGDSEAHYKVYVDEQYKGWFDIEPEEFSLTSKANKGIEITVSPPLLSFGNHTTNIYVTTANPGLQLGVGAGIKVPAHIRVFNLLVWVVIGIAAALLVTLIFFLARRRRRASSEAR